MSVVLPSCSWVNTDNTLSFWALGMFWKAWRFTAGWLWHRVSQGLCGVWTKHVGYVELGGYAAYGQCHLEKMPRKGPWSPMCLSQGFGAHPRVVLLSSSRETQVSSVDVSSIYWNWFHLSNTPSKSKHLQSKRANFQRTWIFVPEGVWELSCDFPGSVLVSCRASGTAWVSEECQDDEFRLEWAQVGGWVL